jgi:hypothetical protein
VSDALRAEIRDLAEPLTGAPSDLDGLLDMIGECRLVLLGEVSHGTHEFYRQRAEISRRLIEEKGLRGWRWRRTGPTPIASTAGYAGTTRPAMPRRRSKAGV